MAYREPNSDEIRLLRALMGKTLLDMIHEDWLHNIKVQSLDDGGMGSFRLHGFDKNPRKTGRLAAELQFMDADGIPILASLFLDDTGQPYKVDVFRADFRPVIRVPNPL